MAQDQPVSINYANTPEMILFMMDRQDKRIAAANKHAAAVMGDSK